MKPLEVPYYPARPKKHSQRSKVRCARVKVLQLEGINIPQFHPGRFGVHQLVCGRLLDERAGNADDLFTTARALDKQVLPWACYAPNICHRLCPPSEDKTITI